ncbi:MAG: hypothetical protein AAB890_00335 [Patescibacteria group bacterium]
MRLVSIYVFGKSLYRILTFLRLNFLAKRDLNYLKLSMNVWERFLVRLFTYLFYGLLIAISLMWIFSEIMWMKIIGIVLALFLADRLWWLKKESTSAWSILEYSLDRATLFGGNFYLWVAERALGYDEVKDLLSLKKSAYKKIRKEIKEELNKTLNAKISKEELLKEAQDLLEDGFNVSPDLLFSRLMEKSKDVKIITDNAGIYPKS